MPYDPLPEVAAFQLFLTGRVWVFGDIRAAPERQDKVPPCAPAGQTDGGTASQLIRSVRPTRERMLQGSDDLVQAVDYAIKFLRGRLREAAADSLNGQRPNLADLDP
jgi:hypothetical protein